MTLADRIGSDVALFDGAQAATYHRRGLDGTTEQSVAVAAAWHGAVRGMPSGVGPDGRAAYEKTTRWHLPSASLPFAPRKGDRVEAADGLWEVDTATASPVGGRWALDCREVLE